MIGKSTEGVVRAMAVISNSHEGREYISELKANLREIDMKLRSAPLDEVNKLQGAAKILEKLINKFEASGENLRSLQNHRQKS